MFSTSSALNESTCIHTVVASNVNELSFWNLSRSLAKNQAHTPPCLSFEFLEYNDKTSNSDLTEVHVLQSDLFSPNKVVLDEWIQQTCWHPNLLIWVLLLFNKNIDFLFSYQCFVVQIFTFCCIFHLIIKVKKFFILTWLKQYLKELEMAKSTKFQWEWDPSAQWGVALKTVEYTTAFLYLDWLYYLSVWHGKH